MVAYGTYQLTEAGERALDALVASAGGKTRGRLKEPFTVRCKGRYALKVPAFVEVSYFCNVTGKSKGAPSATVATFFVASDLQVNVLQGGHVQVVNPYDSKPSGWRRRADPVPHPSGTGITGKVSVRNANL